jgi:hypothetical protein
MPVFFDPCKSPIENEADALESTAEWRRRKAEEYPEDDRNGRAAKALAKLAVEVRRLVGTPLGQEFEALQEKVYTAEWRGSDRLMEDENRHLSRIGFDSFPDTGEEYLRARMEIYAEALREAEEEADEDDEDEEEDEDDETLVAFELDAAVAALARAGARGARLGLAGQIGRLRDEVLMLRDRLGEDDPDDDT